MSTPHTFDVPHGYENERGEVFTTIHMRRVKVSDLIRVANDNRVKQLKAQGHTISMAAMQFADTRREVVPGVIMGGTALAGEIDPLALQCTEAAMLELNCTLFAQVCTIEGLPRVDKAVFKEMTPADLQVIQEQYQRLNEAPRDDDDKKESGDKDGPALDPSSGSPKP
jgi:hypothetical protein